MPNATTLVSYYSVPRHDLAVGAFHWAIRRSINRSKWTFHRSLVTGTLSYLSYKLSEAPTPCPEKKNRQYFGRNF